MPVADGSLRLPVRRGRVLGLPIPRALLPTSNSREFARDGRFRFDVALGAPLGAGLIVGYRGSLTPDADPPADARVSPPAHASALPALEMPPA